jgi:MFS family permease
MRSDQLRYALTSRPNTELEPLLEVERYGYIHCNVFQSRPRASCSGTDVSTIDGVLQFGSCRRGAIHGSLYTGTGFQQLLLVCCPTWQLSFSSIADILCHRIPIQTSYGRRPVLIFSTLICLVSNIWRALATSYGSYMGACVLNGFGAGPAETSQPEIIADIMFLHERGAYNTLYFTVYFGSLMVRGLSSVVRINTNILIGWSNYCWAYG